jgi:arylsulfatase A-like enzyme
MLFKNFNYTLVLLLVAMPLCNSLAQKKSSLNILVIMTDQQRWDALRYSGANDIIQTPNLDKLAKNGAYFSQASSPCPVCCPARTSILTGRLIESTGIRTNMDADNDKKCIYKTFDQILASKGYVAEYIGKFHSPMDMAQVYSNPSQHGYQVPELIKSWEKLYRFYLNENTKKRDATDNELNDFSFFNGTTYKPTPIDRRYDKLPTGKIDENELKVRPLVQPDHNGTLNLKPEYSITAVQGRQTIEALERNKNNKFIITCSFHCPHSPILPIEPYASLYIPSKMPIPKSISDKMEGNPYIKSNGRLLMPEYSDSAKIGYMIADYYALITEIDEWVGKIINKLDELKLKDNTLVIFMSDHGEMLGAHGMREKNVFLEESVRVPLIINFPSEITPIKIATPVSTLNVFSTILDFAGIKAESDGYSLRNLTEGRKSKTDFAVS